MGKFNIINNFPIIFLKTNRHLEDWQLHIKAITSANQNRHRQQWPMKGQSNLHVTSFKPGKHRPSWRPFGCQQYGEKIVIWREPYVRALCLYAGLPKGPLWTKNNLISLESDVRFKADHRSQRVVTKPAWCEITFDPSFWKFFFLLWSRVYLSSFL